MNKVKNMTNIIITDKSIFLNEKHLEENNILSEKKGICLNCEDIVSIEEKTFDLTVTRKLQIPNVTAKCCSVCSEPVAYTTDSVFKINTEITKFKLNRPSVSSLLRTTQESSYRWCESMMCACAGAANCSGELSSYLYDKEDWIKWKSNNKPEHSNFYRIILNHSVRMEMILAIKEILYIGPKDAAECVDKIQATFQLEYNTLEPDDIDYDLEKIKNHFKSKNIDVFITPMEYNEEYTVFGRDE